MRNCRLLLLVFGLALVSCEDRKIKTYEVPRESEESQLLPPAASIAAKPAWEIPPGWKELPPSGMRAASFTIANSKLDVSVVTFPGTAGGLLSNLNRWRGQMGLPAQTEENGFETSTANGQAVQIVEFTSPDGGKGMLGAMFLREDQSWFLKLTGDKAAVLSEGKTFRAFANSFNFQKAVVKKSTNDG